MILRDRIAEAITGIRIQRYGDSYRMADAVIATLGLKPQWINDGIISDGPPPNWVLPCDIRYTTEWERSE